MAAAAASVLVVAALARRRDATALNYALLGLAFGAWGYGRGGHAVGLPWSAQAEALALVAICPTAVLLAARFARAGVLPARLVPALLCGVGVLVLGLLARGVAHPLLADFTRIWAAGGALGGAILLWRRPEPREGADSPEATRLRYLAACHAAIPLAILLDALAPLAGAPRVAIPFAGLVYLYASYLHLARVRVADLLQLSGNTAALLTLAAGLAAFYTGLWHWVGPRVDLYVFDAFVSSFVLLMFVPAIREAIQRLVERRFGARKLELERALVPLQDRLEHIATLDELLRDVLATLERTDRVTSSAVYLRDDPRVGFQQAASIGMPPRSRVNLIRDPVFVGALESGEALLEEEVAPRAAETRPRAERARIERLRDVLRRLDAQLVLPLRAGTQLVGFWTLTDSGSAEPFSAAEIDLLRSVSERTARSIENSKTFEQIRARDRYASLGEMSAGLAHELRNPIAAILGALDVLPRPDDLAARELHDVILEESGRLDRVVSRFLDYSQSTPSSAKLEDPGRFVRECAEAMGRRWASRPVRVEAEVEPDLPAVAADADQLETVLVNLLRNAYDAVEGAGRIRVRAAALPAGDGGVEAIEIVVEDDGPGMEPETLERALVPFFTTKERGTGLGLPLCERLVRDQGGSIEVRSAPGRGTSVAVRLPVCEPPQESEGVEP